MADPTPTAEAIEADDREYVMRPWPHPAGEPVIVARAKNCVITDIHGKDYIDFTAGYFVNNAGHCHPRIVEAATKQLGEVLQVSGKYGTPSIVRLAKRLVQLAPKSLDKAFFSTGGSEANEFALKLARQYAKKPDIAYLQNGYHGLTLGSLEVTASEKYRDSAGKPMGPENFALPMAYCYRCPVGKDVKTCKSECLDGVEQQLASRKTAAIIAEPIQAVGGLAPPQKWWDRLDAIRRKLGILLIADEIQTGLGRTGKMFACEHYNLQPDIMSGGKGLSGGVGSLGVTLASNAVCKEFFGGTTPTSGGNAVSAAAGYALIDTILDEGPSGERPSGERPSGERPSGERMIDNCANMGRYFTEAAWRLDDPWIGDVRFTGLLGGIELVKDRGTKEVLGKTELAKVKDGLHAEGMLITMSGWHGNYLRLQPPLSVTGGQIDQFIAALRKTLTGLRGS